MSDNHDPLQPHSHDPNLETPSGDGSFLLLANGRSHTITPASLHTLPQTAVANCLIVSTGHGTSGPFTFTGVTLLDFLHHHLDNIAWTQVEVVSADGFGNRVQRQELETPDPAGPILLATHRDGSPLTRQQGLVRLIVPSERDDALRQVKWIGEIRVV